LPIFHRRRDHAPFDPAPRGDGAAPVARQAARKPVEEARQYSAMNTYTATIRWARDPSTDFTKGQYSRAHQWEFDGGAVIAASPSPHVVPAPWNDPAGVDPEEAFVASLSSCHMLFFVDFARRDRW